MCVRAVEKYPLYLSDVSDHFKTQDMCDEAVEKYPWSLKYVPDWLKTQGMCERVVKDKQGALENVSDHFKIQGMRDDAVRKRLRLLEYVPDYFVTQQQVKLWHDNAYYCNDNGLIKWCKGYHERKAQKAKIKKQLMPIAWHPSRYWDWCVPEDKKEETEKLWKQI